MSRQPVLFEHPISLEHDTGAHPERADRLRALWAELDRRGGLGYDRRRSQPSPRAALNAVHVEGYASFIEETCLRGGGMLDADTVVSERSYEAALHAAGGAIGVVDAVLGEGAPFAFSLHRPPGHHATASVPMGFCLFNNVAVAAKHALDAHGVRRVLVLDWDVHHGNGTNDIFHTSPEVLFISIHQSPLYPGSGPAGDAGSGAGEGYTINLPVPEGSGDGVFVGLVRDVAVELVRAYQPQLVLVSAGFDAHHEDPLAGCRVTDAGFARMAGAVRGVCTELGIPLGGVLEGGYALEATARSCVAVLGEFGGGDARRELGGGDAPGEVGHADAHASWPDGERRAEELITAARARVARRWPALGGSAA